jgi:dTMP kinase
MGRLIVVEGGDASGKRTQVKLLIDALESAGVRSAHFTFPRYESPIGRVIGRALKGAYGDFRALHPHLASALYTVDRAAAAPRMRELLADAVVVCDRYTPSNIAYQAAKLPIDERQQFIAELEEIEYEDIGLPKPDFVLYLDVPVDLARTLALSRGALDQHEADLAYQEEVARVYRGLISVREQWELVPCAHGDSMRSREDIHRDVLAAVIRRFPELVR